MLRMALLIAALALEGSNLPDVVGHHTDGEALASVLMRHAAASAMLAWFVWDRLPRQLQVSRAWAIVLLFNFAFFVPVVGLPGILAAALVAGLPGEAPVGRPFSSVPLPQFAPVREGQAGEHVHLAIKSFLDGAQLPMARRLKSLLALQGVPHRIATQLLQHMLGDASDDIRLVAYGFLDAGERKVAKDIDRELRNLRAAEDTEQRATCLKQLAELYWELAYSRLAQGDLRARVLDQALFYADEALALAPRAYGVLFLRGRVLLEMHRDDEAYQVFQRAIVKGLPESRALPYIAEIQFRRRDYGQVRSSLLRMSGRPAAPMISGVIDFWAQGNKRGYGGASAQEYL